MGKAKHILELSREEKRSFLDSFDLVVSDCDGVIWEFTGPLAGAKEGLEALQKAGQKKWAFASNNSFSTRAVYEDKFRNLGVPFDYTKDLMHPAEATANYLRKQNISGVIYVMASPSFKQVLESAGFECFSMPNATEVSTLQDIWAMIYAAPKVSAVVYDVDLNFNMTKFYAAQHFLFTSPDCPLIFGAVDKTFIYHEYKYGAVGLFMEALASQAKQEPIILGKPGEKLGEMIVEKFQIKDRSRVLFIGDTLEQDIGFANATGFQSLLVLTGATTREMFTSNTKEIENPTYYADSLLDFVALMRVDDEDKQPAAGGEKETEDVVKINGV